MLPTAMGAHGRMTAPGKARGSPLAGQLHHQAGCPGARGTARVQPPERYRGKTSASCPHHLPQPLAISDKNSLSPPCGAGRQAAACPSWAARLSFSVYRAAPILASSCSREVLLVETPARCSARPSQPPGSAGSRCSQPHGPVGR